jgi:hypothetical protein
MTEEEKQQLYDDLEIELMEKIEDAITSVGVNIMAAMMRDKRAGTEEANCDYPSRQTIQDAHEAASMTTTMAIELTEKINRGLQKKAQILAIAHKIWNIYDEVQRIMPSWDD